MSQQKRSNNQALSQLRPMMSLRLTNLGDYPKLKTEQSLRSGRVQDKHSVFFRDDGLWKYYIGWGNNEAVVRRVMDCRSNWKESTERNTMMVNFKWQQSDRGYKYDRLILSETYRQVVNHFEYHQEICNKQYLIMNLTQHCLKHNLNVFEYTPLTFILDFEDENCDYNLGQFIKTYEYFTPPSLRKMNHSKYATDHRRKLRSHISANYFSNRESKPVKVHQTFVTEDNFLWLLKPTFLNRGRGIHVFNTLEQLTKLITEYIEGVTIQGELIKARAFVIQKYVERPALIHNRKFDVRVWGLLTHDLEAYFFSEGYIRTSSEEYDSTDTNNQFIHLTNNAIQKHSTNYGQFEKGNQMSWQEYQTYNPEAKISKIVERMKELIWMTFQSVKKKINSQDRKFSFEIFGFDFILDESYQVWLIEVNTNPCIEESSPLLQRLIPRMLDDAFKLTIDVLFPRSNHDKERAEKFHVPGYVDDENMWILLGSLEQRRKQVPRRKHWKPSM